MSGSSLARVRTKICGITSVKDAMCAIEMGADAIGLVFYEPSPRAVTIDQAKEICAALPPFVTVVALTVNAPRSFVEQIVERLPVSLLQFHGDEDECDCLGFSVPYVKALRVKNEQDVSEAERAFPSASGILVDTYKKGVPGGTGEIFDWGLLPKSRVKSLILAGGLNPENVRTAIAAVKPFAVDVSGGVEVSPGIKSPELVKQFIQEVSRERTS
jgi:phosphoribosylanthranilate isomerase